jgi:hypothetical protein
MADLVKKDTPLKISSPLQGGQWLCPLRGHFAMAVPGHFAMAVPGHFAMAVPGHFVQPP